MVERARRYAAAIREEPGLTQGQLAEREGVSGPRVNQVLSILRLDPSILADLTDLEREEPVPSLDELFVIGRLPGGRAQVTRYRAVCAALAGERVGVKVQAARQRRFQHLFARARVWQAALDSGQFRSLSELAGAEGVSHHRVAQVLDLLTLPREIQAALDVPFEELPAGITQAEVRALARMGDAEAQRTAFAAICARRTRSGPGQR
jgi:transcriptional regulator with XRE-family HTH domain